MVRDAGANSSNSESARSENTHSFPEVQRPLLHIKTVPPPIISESLGFYELA